MPRHTMSDRCHDCDLPRASREDWDNIPEGEGEHLCWGDCEPIDWRQRCLDAEAEIKVARVVVNAARVYIRGPGLAPSPYSVTQPGMPDRLALLEAAVRGYEGEYGR